jgi:hypothetical protein
VPKSIGPPKTANMIQQPKARPTFLCLPLLVRGIPVLREMRPLSADRPVARFHEKEKPYFFIARICYLTSP